jgi:hypothetical protein
LSPTELSSPTKPKTGLTGVTEDAKYDTPDMTRIQKQFPAFSNDGQAANHYHLYRKDFQ